MKTLFTSFILVAFLLGANAQTQKAVKTTSEKSKQVKVATEKAIKEAANKAAAEKTKKEAELKAAAEKEKKEAADKAAAEKTKKEPVVKIKKAVAKESADKTASTREANLEEVSDVSNEANVYQSVVSPNPLPSGIGKISVDGFNENGIITIISTGGGEVFTQILQNGAANFESLPTGTYVYKVSNSNGLVISKGKFIVTN